MKTIGKDKQPKWVRKIVGERKGIEIKTQNNRYYAYKSTSVWNKEKQKPEKVSEYMGVVTRKGIQPPHQSSLNGIYEYGHVAFVWNLLKKHGIVKALKENFSHWETILVFAMNRLIDPRPIKSMKSWYEKTYLAKQLRAPMSPKTISKTLKNVGKDWNAQRKFFSQMKKKGEKIVYDKSVIFSSSKNNPLLETGHNKDHLLLPKVNILMAFSHDRFIPVFFRIVPGSIHEVTTLDILLEELGKNITLIMDKGFTSIKEAKKINTKGMKFVVPLRRNSKIVNYNPKLENFFMYKGRPIKYRSYKHGKFYVYLYQDLTLRTEEEKSYYQMLDKGKEPDFKEKWAGKIPILSNKKIEPEELYGIWKMRGGIEKAFDVLQNMLDTDRPYVKNKNTFCGYLFSSFISLIAYYLILKLLKKHELNNKVSVQDILLEFSKIYQVEIRNREVLSEISKKNRRLMKDLDIENLLTKNGKS